MFSATFASAWTGAPASLPAWAGMWTLAFAIYAGCKWLTWRRVVWRGAGWRGAAYLLAWPGMDPRRFLESPRSADPTRPTAAEWFEAAAKTIFGAILVTATRSIPADGELLRGWTGLVGIAFLLHFGIFDLLSCLWRSLGVDAGPIMRFPAASHSVSEFWGRRWNLAFRDLAHTYLFRPLTPLLGATAAVVVGFLASGLVHDLVISVPAGGRYGLPTLYFLLQPAAIVVERSAAGRRLGLGHGVRGWLFTAAVVLAPAPLLFHRAFLHSVLLPFLDVLTGA